MKAQRGVEIQSYTFLNRFTRWGQWLNPRPGRFIPGHDHVLIVDEPQGRTGHVRKTSTITVNYEQANLSAAIPLQAWRGPEGSRKLRFPDFMKTAQDCVKVVSLTHRPPLPPGNTPGTHLY
jgi:hypothetical protein